MKVSENWLRSFINLPERVEIADQLFKAGIEVDALEVTPDSEDAIFTLKVPPTRGDCLSVEGLARELAVINQMTMQPIVVKSSSEFSKTAFSVNIETPTLCSHYCGRVITGISNKKVTPDWMQERLMSADITLHSPAVDICNYVMLELGQPLHAFDLDQLAGSTLTVRLARSGETLTTLDNKKIDLQAQALIIADKKGPQALAGIIGGLASSVNENTQAVFIESAYFDPISIRKTSQFYKIRTDSAYRFERGIDPNLQMRALNRATELFLEILGGQAQELIEIPTTPVFSLSKILLRPKKIQALLGVCPEDSEIKKILESLGMKVAVQALGFEVMVPSYRRDLTLEVDLIEEIARLWGYDHIPQSLPSIQLQAYSLRDPQAMVQDLKQTLVNRGYSETINYSFISETEAVTFSNTQTPLFLANPLSTEMAVMRDSLWPGLIKVLQFNQNRNQPRVRIFEVGTVFGAGIERQMLSGLISGSLFKESWGDKSKNLDFFDVKADVQALLAYSKQNYEFQSGNHAVLDPGQTALIKQGSETVGILGALHPAIVQNHKITGPVFLFELKLNELFEIKLPKFQELSKFPEIRRDIAIIVDQKVLAMELKSAIVFAGGPLLREVFIFDVYQGKGIREGGKSIAFGLILQHPERTLTEDEVSEVMNTIIHHLSTQYHAVLRE